MLHVISYLFIAISLGYAFLVVYYIYHWSKHPHSQPENLVNDEWPTVAVIIPFRNEANHLTQLVSDLKNQDYSGSYEVIFINDHSEDHPESQLLNLPDNFRVLDPTLQVQGKKSALEAGIKDSESQYLLFSDADTSRGEKWIQTMVSCALQQKADMVTGPVLAAEEENHWLAQYYRSELAAFLVVTAGAIKGRLHAMANGANMLVKRSQLPLDDPFGKNKSESGDDLFLAEWFFEKDALVFCKSITAVVSTYPPPSENQLIQQKIRWAGKNKLLRSGAIRPAMFVTAALPLAVLSTPIFALFYGSSLLWLGLGMFLIKTVTDHVLINQGLSWKNEAVSWETSIRQQLTNLMITARTLLALILGHNTQWKGRKF